MELTKQQIYETVREWFTRPGAVLGMESGSAMGMCVYRGNRDPESPWRCPIGVLIPDECYSPDVENIRISDLLGSPLDVGRTEQIDRLRVYFSGTGTSALEFMQEMQTAHDGRSSTACEFVCRLDELAREHLLALSPAAVGVDSNA